ncbi:outer membrane lipoprotein-sorting protein [Treponema parvum]|uniref:outer membrane lipoprotein-sorting protein n=1 Tax=Treponema parvum TaxID=138851 RepID=UPI001AEBCBD6|nr:outer membrane lipoprotein-sorting protein [Treponema parvum]QTQ16497.1 outer membrane lipoprotein-sorting protein [Treponema parvum]
MTYLKKILLVCAFASVFAVLPVFSQTAYDIMKASRDRYEGDTAVYEMQMTLIAKNGTKRLREVSYFSKDYGDYKRTVMFFLTPKDVTGVGYLVWEYDEEGKDDDTWLYMPAMKKVRRIAGSGKDDYFMGTDFTYNDMGNRELSKDDFSILSEETVDGFACWKIQCVPHDTTERNSRRVYWIRKDNYIAIKGELYNRQKNLERVLSVKDVEQIDGIWTAKTFSMENLASGHSTLLEIKNITYNKSLDDSIFTVASLEKGRMGR